MSRLKIFYVVNEIDPFLSLTSSASFVRQLAQAMVQQGHEVRIVMPRFGLINERVNRIHEIQRLSGINIRLGEQHVSLIVKVASIKEAKLQVYFIDNEDLFNNKEIFFDQQGRPSSQNDKRISFINKSSLAILQHLGWMPNIIHAVGAPWGLLPLYAKKSYANDPALADTKIVLTCDALYTEKPMAPNILPIAMGRNVGETELELLKESNYESFVTLGQKYADLTFCSFTEDAPKVTALMQKLNIQEIFPQFPESAEHYENHYHTLCE